MQNVSPQNQINNMYYFATNN